MLGQRELLGIKVDYGQIISILWSHSSQKNTSTIKPLLLKIPLALFFKNLIQATACPKHYIVVTWSLLCSSLWARKTWDDRVKRIGSKSDKQKS